jgi:hypothetical protein
MNRYCLRLLPGLLCLFVVFRAQAQLSFPHAVLHFTGEVTAVSGAPLPGLAAGHSFTGRLEVSLGTLPPDTNPDPEESDYIYDGAPSLGFYQLGIDFHTEGPIVHTRSFQPYDNLPHEYHRNGIFLRQHALAAHSITFRLQYTLAPYGLYLAFFDTNPFPALLRGDHFPEHVNPAFPFHLSEISFYSPYETNAFYGRITGASFAIVAGVPPGLILTERVTGADLQPRLKSRLLKKSRRIEAALRRPNCRVARQRVKSFQSMVRKQLQPANPALAQILIGRAQSVLEDRCPPRSLRSP